VLLRECETSPSRNGKATARKNCFSGLLCFVATGIFTWFMNIMMAITTEETVPVSLSYSYSYFLAWISGAFAIIAAIINFVSPDNMPPSLPPHIREYV